MGLDMWLYTNSRKVAEELNDQSDEWEAGYQIPNGIAIGWRKANAIHRWFVANVQGGKDDCGLYEVDVNALVRLHDACREVLDSTKLVDAEVQNGSIIKDGEWVPNMVMGQRLEDPTKAAELLPTQDGFFFGGTDYDQWYWWDVQYTEAKLAKLLDCIVPASERNWHVEHRDEPGWHVKFYYTSSW